MANLGVQFLTWDQTHQIIIQCLGAIVESGTLCGRNRKSRIVEEHPVGIVLKDFLLRLLELRLMEFAEWEGQCRVKIIQRSQVALNEVA